MNIQRTAVSDLVGWARLAVVLLTLSSFVTASVVPTQREEATKDTFGINKIRPSAVDGMSWQAQWNSKRALNNDFDQDDPWFFLPSERATYKAENGVLSISGDTPRMSVHDPKLRRQWRDVEITMYFQRVSDEGTAYAGMVAVTRSNHGASGSIEKNLCDTRGIGGRLRYDGTADFEKEIRHPSNASTDQKVVWPGGMPKNKWFGYKYLVYDLPDGSVKLEIWLDETGGVDGGTWLKVNEMIDSGSEFVKARTVKPCKSGVNPSAILTNVSFREGSESGEPNLSTYFRSDNVGQSGLLYKWGSIREITPTDFK